MKALLLVLSGDSERACTWVRDKYPDTSIEILSRYELEKNGALARLRIARQMHPDIFIITTERLEWQRGQNAILVFGALAGARRVIILDARGASREDTSASILARTPFRLMNESAASLSALIRSKSKLRKLEIEVAAGAPFTLRSDQKNLNIASLRSTPSPGSHAGGAATHINGFVNGATELGATINVISNDYIAGLDESRLNLIDPEPTGSTRAAFDLRNNLIFSAGVLRELERRPADLIYQRYGRFTWAGVEAGLRAAVPLFLEYNGSEVWIGKHWDMSGMIPLLERFERLNLKAASRIFVVSEVERRNLLRLGIADEKIIVNPNAVDTDKFRPDIGGASARQELGIGPREILAGFVGTFGPWHGVLTLAEAITLMPAKSSVRFLLVGAGRFRDEVERIIRTAGKTDSVIFTGHLDHERIPALLDACDVLLSPHVPLEDGSEFFGSPTKLFEYMAMGKAIVASRLGQIGEVLTDDESGILIEPGNARQLAEAILRLSESPDLRQRLGAAARLAAVEQHTWKQNAQRVIDEYRMLTGIRSSDSPCH
ncbi:MAG TPA: glycosyltransferase family 4 protein [Pyrinomonadaceae bacterium]|nr:glycosyltransferase family 4 protein [Pyrinomonadaceae bacterium]